MTVTFDIPDETSFISYTIIATKLVGLDHKVDIFVSGFDPRKHKGCVVKMESTPSDMKSYLIPRDGGDAE